jgi:hypothetical protein
MAAVRAGLEENTDRHRIIRWHPPQPATDGQDSTIRVVYEYAQTSRKTIQTDRVFFVRENRVTAVESAR